jgi:hypothetical protein
MLWNAPFDVLESLSSGIDTRCREMPELYLGFLAGVPVVRKIRALMVFPNKPVSETFRAVRLADSSGTPVFDTIGIIGLAGRLQLHNALSGRCLGQ